MWDKKLFRFNVNIHDRIIMNRGRGEREKKKERTSSAWTSYYLLTCATLGNLIIFYLANI